MMLRVFGIGWVLGAAALVVGQGPPHRRGGSVQDLADLPPLLKKAAEVAPKLSYAGIRTIEFRRGPNRTRHREQVIKDGPRFRIEFPGDSPFAGQIIVETPEGRQHFFPDRNEIFVTPPRGDEAFFRIRGLAGRFGPGRVQFRTENPVAIAGVRTTPVAATDPQGNVLIRLWIDPRTGMVLKREFYDHVGTVVGLLEFTEIRFNPIVRDSDFQIRREGAKTVTPMDLAKGLMKEHGMAEVFLPSDFGLQLEHARIVPGPQKPVLVLLYQSPQGPVSFYQVAGELDPRRLRQEARRDFRTVSWSDRGRTFVIVGELSEAELQQVARKARGG